MTLDSSEPPADRPRIRRAVPAEAARVAAFGARQFREAYGDTHPEPTLSTYLRTAFDAALFDRCLRGTDAEILLAERGPDEWIGYAQLREGFPDSTSRLEQDLPGARPLEIVRFYTDAAWHGRGVASDLMAACEAAARRRACDVLWLQAWQAAERALAFYRKMGFRVIGTATFRFGEREDADFVLARRVETIP